MECPTKTLNECEWRAGSTCCKITIIVHPYNRYNGDWYRLLLDGRNAQMPVSCVPFRHCGTNIPWWINGSNPSVSDGVVERELCGTVRSDCCYYRPGPMLMKACPGDYYVYRFINPNIDASGFCAGKKMWM